MHMDMLSCEAGFQTEYNEPLIMKTSPLYERRGFGRNLNQKVSGPNFPTPK
jgi:hypothetical protein